VTTFIDTSAFYAVLDRDDAHHLRAKTSWEVLLTSGAAVVTTNYVLVETLALLQYRLGVGAVRAFQEDIRPLLRVDWIDAALHEAAVAGVLSAGRRKLSLVDCSSFAVMRRLGVREAFAFDPHFAEQGFSCLPEAT
jgi:predicted nucleic acid-binding protein